MIQIVRMVALSTVLQSATGLADLDHTDTTATHNNASIPRLSVQPIVKRVAARQVQALVITVIADMDSQMDHQGYAKRVIRTALMVAETKVLVGVMAVVNREDSDTM